MHYASMRNDTNLAAMLLNYNANVNICDKFGKTPLHYACERNAVNVAKLLTYLQEKEK